jgi:hypothetical protein
MQRCNDTGALRYGRCRKFCGLRAREVKRESYPLGDESERVAEIDPHEARHGDRHERQWIIKNSNDAARAASSVIEAGHPIESLPPARDPVIRKIYSRASSE